MGSRGAQSVLLLHTRAPMLRTRNCSYADAMSRYRVSFVLVLGLGLGAGCQGDIELSAADGGVTGAPQDDAASHSESSAGTSADSGKPASGGGSAGSGNAGAPVPVTSSDAATGDATADSGSSSDAGTTVADAAPSDAAAQDAAQPDATQPDAAQPDAAQSDAGAPNPPAGKSMIVGVGSWGLRARSQEGAPFVICRNPSTGNDHSPDLLRDVGYGDGVFVAVGGDANAMVMRSLDAVHWQEDLHPTAGCSDSYPSSCNNWMGGVAYHHGVWLAGGGNGALMRSKDGGLTWSGVHPKPTPTPIRHMAGGSGRFVAGGDSGAVFVTSDDGDSWQRFDLWTSQSQGMRIAHGAGSFIAWGTWYNNSTSKNEQACFVSADKGDHWQPCDSAVATSASFVHDGTRWVARTGSGYATSADGVSWTMHAASGVPSELLFDGSTWYGRTGSTFSSGATPDAFKVISGTKASDYRSWTIGIVLDSNLPVMGVPECSDKG